jgi:hypothetical protein
MEKWNNRFWWIACGWLLFCMAAVDTTQYKSVQTLFMLDLLLFWTTAIMIGWYVFELVKPKISQWLNQ